MQTAAAQAVGGISFTLVICLCQHYVLEYQRGFAAYEQDTARGHHVRSQSRRLASSMCFHAS